MSVCLFTFYNTWVGTPFHSRQITFHSLKQKPKTILLFKIKKLKWG